MYRKKKLSLAAQLNLGFFQALFQLLSLLKPPFPKTSNLGRGKKVLIFTTAGIGDTLLDSPAILSLAKTYEGIELHAVAHHKRLSLCQHNPYLKKVHPFSKGPLAFPFLYLRLQREGPWDAILYLSCLDPEPRCLGYLLNRHVTAGLGFRTKLNWLCAHVIDGEDFRREHFSRQALQVASVFGARQDITEMVYKVESHEKKQLDAFLFNQNFPLEAPITFQIGGGGAPHRDWPTECFIKLFHTLANLKIAGPFFLLGGTDHLEKAREISHKTQGLPVYNLVGRLTLPLSAALLERSRCVVSTDTGILHLAFALKVPTVALLHWSPGSRRIGPLANQHLFEIIEIPRPAQDDKPWLTPMNLISPDIVASKLINHLAKFHHIPKPVSV